MQQGDSTSGQKILILVLNWSSQCLKITEKVLFNIASEASYVYILSGQKLTKNTKNGPFWRFFENLKIVVKQWDQTGYFWWDKNWFKNSHFE